MLKKTLDATLVAFILPWGSFPFNFVWQRQAFLRNVLFNVVTGKTVGSTSIKKVLFCCSVICSTWYVLKNWTIFSWCCNNLMQKCKVKYANHKHQNQHLNMSIMSSFFFIENKIVNMQIKVNNISAFSFVLWNKAIRNIRTPVEVM